MLIYRVLYLPPYTELISGCYCSFLHHLFFKLSRQSYLLRFKVLRIFTRHFFFLLFMEGGYATNDNSTESDGDSSNTTVSFSPPFWAFKFSERHHLCSLANHIYFRYLLEGLIQISLRMISANFSPSMVK